ncbi:CPXCG motif-containing cysteine-rich protein [Bowmanella dokdonensis]|uniref:CPXCG motif-containing cysteine-rich protein n=1 Tax=Bowmanella dokdonensis TaxID=751969 RepID=A0A939DLF9_9ALTE|nr:CPXCG motif-containing cysteine-rich protein [Bowmanella dokdonensis]MBN7824457.1 CPXCG motif-containing cysteine-rich protein [Bowmanella dokdonensis]
MKAKTVQIDCPQCGHSLHLLLDYSQGDQDYFEECANCCHSIRITMHVDEERKKLTYRVNADDEQYY